MIPADAPTVKAMRLQVLDTGKTVHQLLVPGKRGTVLGVVSQAIYLRDDSGELFWLTTAEVPRHPRGIRSPVPLPRVPVGTPFAVDEPGLLSIGPDIVLDYHRASIWSPPAFSSKGVLPLSALPERVRAACKAVESLPSPAGLGALLPESPGSVADTRPFSWAAGQPLAALPLPVVEEIAEACRRHDIAKALARAEPLIGLGEGLTPAGDDFVGGLLFCLYWFSRLYADRLATVDLADAIGRFRGHTNPISFTLLNDLANGQGVEPLHEWLRGILTGSSLDVLRHQAARLVRMGHSTGWGLLSGACIALLWGSG